MNTLKAIFSVILVVAFVSCNNTPKQEPTATETNTELIQPLVQEVLTQEQRDALSPDEILQSFKDGNQRFISNNLTARDHSEQVRKSATGQFPKAVILSCLDSRVPVEDVFDRGIGDIFVGRVAGNFVN